MRKFSFQPSHAVPLKSLGPNQLLEPKCATFSGTLSPLQSFKATSRTNCLSGSLCIRALGPFPTRRRSVRGDGCEVVGSRAGTPDDRENGVGTGVFVSKKL